MKSQAGFTIAELLVVMVIIALIGTVSMPMIARRTGTATLETEFRNIMHSARAKALAERRPVDVIIDAARHTVSLDGKDLKLVWDNRETVAIKAVRAQPQSDTVLFRFFANGTSSGGDIAVGDNGRKKIITVNWLTGAIRLTESTR